MYVRDHVHLYWTVHIPGDTPPHTHVHTTCKLLWERRCRFHDKKSKGHTGQEYANTHTHVCLHADTCVFMCMCVCLCLWSGRGGETIDRVGPLVMVNVISGRQGFSHLLTQFSQLAQLSYIMEILFFVLVWYSLFAHKECHQKCYQPC